METQKTESKKNQKQNTSALAPTQSTKDLALTSDLEGSWGAEEATAEDIIIPKLLLMHGQSELVLQGHKQVGELIKSTDHEVLAKRGETINIIPFKMFKTWRISEIVGGQAEWRGEEVWNAANTDLPWEFTSEDGKQMRRDQAYNFYALLTKDIGQGKRPFPIRLQFVRTSRKAGRVLADHFAQARMNNKPPALMTFDIGSEFVNGEENKYFVFTAKYGEASTMDQVQAAKLWFNEINKAGNRVKNDDGEKTSVGTNTDHDEF